MSKPTRVPISEKSKIKLLLWSERHCCFCGKQCTTNIEIHHVDENPGNDNEDNFIPLCFDCHGELARYNPKHPVGLDYRNKEIKSRRDQIYEMYTLKYLRQVEIKIGNRPRNNPAEVSCTVQILSNDIPVKLRLEITSYIDEKLTKEPFEPHYTGKTLWNLNPGSIVSSYFTYPSLSQRQFQQSTFRLEVEWSIIDIFEREHPMLPFSYYRNLEADEGWWYHPAIGPYFEVDNQNGREN